VRSSRNPSPLWKLCSARLNEMTSAKPHIARDGGVVELGEAQLSDAYLQGWNSRAPHALDEMSDEEEAASQAGEMDGTASVQASPLELSDAAVPEGLRERPVSPAPPPKRARTQPPTVAVHTDEPTHVGVRQTGVAVAAGGAGSARGIGPPPVIVMTYGAGHQLRQSGQLIWCRRCGKYGETRMRSDGLGGKCEPERRNHTQLNRLREGRHPTTKAPLAPERPFDR
jgi:hypothetical protein